MSKIQQFKPPMSNPFIAGGVRVHPKKGAAKKKKLFGVAVRYRHGNRLASKCITIEGIA